MNTVTGVIGDHCRIWSPLEAMYRELFGGDVWGGEGHITPFVIATRSNHQTNEQKQGEE